MEHVNRRLVKISIPILVALSILCYLFATKYISAENPNHISFVSKGRSIKVIAEIPVTPPEIELLSIKSEDFSEEDVLRWFGENPSNVNRWKDISPFTGETTNIFILSSGARLKIIPKNNRIFLIPNKLSINDYVPTNISDSKAVELATDFIKSHGGFPSDAKVDKVLAMSTVRLSLESTVEASREIPVVLAKTVRFVRDNNKWKRRIVGRDILDVEIDGDGVIHYHRLWREIIGFDKTKKLKIISARQAIEALKEQADSMYSKSGLPKKTVITKIELVYWTGSIDCDPLFAEPAWAFEFQDGDKRREVYISALNGKELD